MCLTAFKAVMYMGEGNDEEEQNNNERKMIRRPLPSDRDKWNDLPPVPTRTEMGYLHLSFEYHRGALRVRVWQISDLLLPPPQISMIHSIFVRGYFLPDKVKKTHRRTEEVLVDVPDKNGVDRPKDSIQHIFTPSSFKFRQPLMYTGMTTAIIRERSMQLEVCMTHKRTRQVYLMAMVHMPLRTALRRPIREKYPLIPCLNHTTPNSMRVYSATSLHLHNNNNNSDGFKGAHFQGPAFTGGHSNGAVTSLDSGREDEEELDDPVSMTGEDFLRSHLSLCLDDTDDGDDDGDDDDDSLAKSGSSNGSRMMTSQSSNGVGSGTSSSSNTLNNPSSGDEADNDYDVTGIDGDDDDDDDMYTESAMAEPNTGSPSPDTSIHNTSGLSASKRKIIPNEVVRDEDDLSHNAEQDLTTDRGDMVNGNPSSPCLDTAHVNPLSSRSPYTPGSGSGDPHTPGSSQTQGADSPDTDGGESPHGTHGARKKIIPANVELPRSSSEADNGKESIGHADRSAGSAFSHVPKSSHKKNDRPAENTHDQTHVPTKPVAQGSTTSLTENSAEENMAATGTTPKNNLPPADPTSSHLSPITDTFSPASRPETPCWDFYDFSEDQGGDLESGALCLEDSLSQLRQVGIGSLQGLSMEPILPMVLVDDFDALTVEDD